MKLIGVYISNIRIERANIIREIILELFTMLNRIIYLNYENSIVVTIYF